MSSRALQVRPLDILIAVSIVAVLVFGIAWNPTNAATGPTGLVTVNPTRVLNTRTGAKPAAGDKISVETGYTGASAVVVNITTVDTAEDGQFVTAWASGPRPDTSVLNASAGQTIANSVIVPVAPDGTFLLYTSVSAHLIVDISGYFDGGTTIPLGEVTSAITGYEPDPDSEEGTLVTGTVSNGTPTDFGGMRVEVICPEGSLRTDWFSLDPWESPKGFDVVCPGSWDAGATIRAVVDL